MWPVLAPLIDELAGALIARLFLWRRGSHTFVVPAGAMPLPSFRGDLEAFYAAPRRDLRLDRPSTNSRADEEIRCDDFWFQSAISTGFDDNDRVHVRRWSTTDARLSVLGFGGVVQLGYYWFDGLGVALARRGIELLMMDEPFNHRRTPRGFRPGELIIGSGPEQLIAAVRQAVIDARVLIADLRARGRRVGIVGQSYGGWICLLLALLEPELEFAVPLVPLSDPPAWYRAGLPLARGARRRFPGFSQSDLAELLRPVNPIAWKPQLPGNRIDLHAARSDRLVLFKSIEQLARAWNTRFTAHGAGHYSMFFGDQLRGHVLRFVDESFRPAGHNDSTQRPGPP